MSTNLALQSKHSEWVYFNPPETEEDLHKSSSRVLDKYIFGTIDIESTPPESKEFTIEDEYNSYQDHKAEIEEKYMGQYVAVYLGKVVDFNSDKSTLLHRFYDKFGNKTVYIKKVGEPERVYKVHTPFRR